MRRGQPCQERGHLGNEVNVEQKHPKQNKITCEGPRLGESGVFDGMEVARVARI